MELEPQSLKKMEDVVADGGQRVTKRNINAIPTSKITHNEDTRDLRGFCSSEISSLLSAAAWFSPTSRGAVPSQKLPRESQRRNVYTEQPYPLC